MLLTTIFLSVFKSQDCVVKISAYLPQLTSWIFLPHLSTTCSKGAFRVVLCLLCVICRASSTISLKISSKSAGQIWTKLSRNVPWNVLFKMCSQNLIPSKTVVAMAIISQGCSLGDPFQNCYRILIHQ